MTGLLARCYRPVGNWPLSPRDINGRLTGEGARTRPPVPGLPAGWSALFSIARLSGRPMTSYTSMTKVQVRNSILYEMASSRRVPNLLEGADFS